MQETDLFYPEMNVAVGNYTLIDGVSIEVYSSKESYFDWAKIKFTGQFKDKLNIAAKERAIIQLGYAGSLISVFDGYVAKAYDSGSFADEILLKDEMMLLEETMINNTFIDTSPQEIIEYCLAKAGTQKMQLTQRAYPSKKRIPVYQKSVIAVINEMKTVWGIDDKFFFSGGTFYFGEKPKQDKVYTFGYGANIIDLTRPGGVWELETVSMPFVKHSQMISVDHPQVSGEFEVIKVSFDTNDAGFIRTHIYF